MCPVGYKLVESLLAWSMVAGQWIGVDLCLSEDREGIVVRQDTNETVDIYQVHIPNKTFWVIEE